MAQPTAPTLATVAATALKDSGWRTPPTDLTSEAAGRWAAQIKNDIWSREKKLNALQKQAFAVAQLGRSRYSFPTDFASVLSIALLYGMRTGTAQDATANTIQLDALDESNADILGREILITAGTGVGSLSQAVDINTTNKQVSVAPDWTTTPVQGSTYMTIDTYWPVDQGPAWRLEELTQPTMRNRPTRFYPVGDADFGEFVFDTVPDKAYGMRIRYYANLMTLDEASTTWATFLQRFENVFYKGLFARALKRKDDDRWQAAEQDYWAAIKRTISEERYGTDIRVIQDRVTDYQ
jgi:hypothetical protein